ncbi:MAG: hypothetical protein GQ564_07030 [Bacteroidales bacterium]|nr:hypothetical protein [Bacteroidales bacterium]
MKKMNLIKLTGMLAIAIMFSLSSCSDDSTDDNGNDNGTPDNTVTSTSELLVEKFTTAPNLDGEIDAMWGAAQKLVGTTTVPSLGARMTYLNSDGEGTEEDLGLFDPYAGEAYDFTLRAGYTESDIYFLMEWADDKDSKDRQSWYFDATDKLWKGEHKYANDLNDKFYEDKFAFLFPIGDVTGFDAGSCYSTCHVATSINNPKDKHTRHYLTTEGEKIDMWHWKRVRGTYLGQVDDQKMVYDDATEGSSANGRAGDATGSGGYSNNSQTLAITGTTTEVSVPMYIIPEETEYYWIDADQITNGTAKLITAVDAEGVLSYEGGGTIDPADGGFNQGTGTKRIPSVTTKAFTEGRGDIMISAVHNGTGWVTEFSRKLDTMDEDDVVFDVTAEIPFGLAIFNNAAIAHAIKTNLVLTFE